LTEKQLKSKNFREKENTSTWLDQVNRGGLITPSQLSVISLAHAWFFFETLMKNPSSKTFLLSTVSNQMSVFVRALTLKMKEVSETKTILDTVCVDGHKFQKHFQEISGRMFNIASKNLVTEINSVIHASKKRSNFSKSSSTRKIAKLQSE
jgi:hypothetical protein